MNQQFDKRRWLNQDRIKAVPIVDILAFYGYSPSKAKGNDVWYLAPWRNERHASMHVHVRQNRWIDFGEEDKGHSNIDLIIKLGIANNYYDAAKWIHDKFLRAGIDDLDQLRRKSTQDIKPAKATKSIIHMNVHPVQNQTLLDYYVMVRRIPSTVVCSYCDEVTYSRGGGIQYKAVGIKNQSGGYAVRTPDFKGDVGPSDITLLTNKGVSCSVFEGFINFLSYVVLSGNPVGDVIILNSVHNLPLALPFLRKYNTVECFQDNDQAGRKATAVILKACGDKAVDRSARYAGFNDINDYLKSLTLNNL